jgi:hypothetical protein
MRVLYRHTTIKANVVCPRFECLFNNCIIDAFQIFDDEASLSIKVDQLVQLITTSQCMIAHTGAGISTAAGIADFR